MNDTHGMPSRRTFTVLLGAGLAGLPQRSQAAGTAKITIGYTATLGFTAAFVAKDQGLFARRGLDVDLLLITLNSTIPAALVGGSIQIGGPTPTVLLQANDGGLDLVVVSGCAGIDPRNTTDGLMVRQGAAIAKPADFIGKKVGVPGLNAIYHVLVRKWLSDHGTDWRRVNFVEVPFTQSGDVLRSGSVDAVATGQPFSQRVVADKIGTLLVTYAEIAPGSPPSIDYVATREWAQANRGTVAAFREAIAEAVGIAAADPDRARASAAKFIKLPPEVLSSLSPPLLQTDAAPEPMTFWVDAMTQQDMLQDEPNLARLMFR